MLSTRNKIIVIADQLIRQRGYNAFSYADIAATLNLKNAAIHYHFPSKAKLGVAVIDETREKFKNHIETYKALSSLEQLNTFFDMYSKNSKHESICFMGALGASFNTLPDEMTIALAEAHKEIVAWLNKLLATGKEKGEFNFTVEPQKITDLITSSILASLVLQRVSNQEKLNNVRQTILTEILTK